MKSIFGKADLHIHSDYSRDAFSPIKEVLKRADEINLDLIAITDHDTMEGVKQAEKIAPEFKVKLINGEEISTKEGHLIGLFIENFISPGKLILDAIREIHSQGGLAIVPHPLTRLSQGVSLNTLFQIFKEVDGIETFNASWLGWINQKKVEKLNSQFFHLAQIGGSDAHVLREVGKAYTIFKGKNPSDLYLAIKNKTTQAEGSFDLLSYLELLINQPRRLPRIIHRF